jgi:hypothetical protein
VTEIYGRHDSVSFRRVVAVGDAKSDLRLSGSGKVTIYGAVTLMDVGLAVVAIGIGNAKGRGNSYVQGLGHIRLQD